MNKDLDGPSLIVLDVFQSLLFFFDCGNSKHRKCKIVRSGQDGLNRKLLVFNSIRNPIGLTINVATQTLFWFEPDIHSLVSIKYDGQNKKPLLLKDYNLLPFATDVFEDSLYFSNLDLRAIIRVDLNSFQMHTVAHAVGVRSIKVIHSAKQPILNNYCLNSTCSHICLPSLTVGNSENYRCFCRIGYELLQNRHSCMARHTVKKTIFTFFENVLSSKISTTKSNSSFNNSLYFHEENLRNGHNSSHNLNYAMVSDAHLVFIITAVFLTIGIIVLILFIILYRHYQR